MNLRVATMSVLLASCTFGGSDEDPTNGLSPVQVNIDGGEPSTDGDDADDDEPMTRLDASSSRPDSSVRGDASAGDSGARDGGAKDGGSTICKAPTAHVVCDPVNNTGCNPFAQCDVDPDGMSASGRCVYWTISLGGCSANALNETCDPKNTCVNNTCRKLCYCDSDCPSGQKCSEAAPGPAGPVKLCK